MTYHIKEYRLKRKMTQGQLCEKANISRTYLSQLENGTKKEISVGVLKRLSDALRVSPNSLFS